MEQEIKSQEQDEDVQSSAHRAAADLVRSCITNPIQSAIHDPNSFTVTVSLGRLIQDPIKALKFRLGESHNLRQTEK